MYRSFNLNYTMKYPTGQNSQLSSGPQHKLSSPQYASWLCTVRVRYALVPRLPGSYSSRKFDEYMTNLSEMTIYKTLIDAQTRADLTDRDDEERSRRRRTA